jgi:hypothetical protein
MTKDWWRSRLLAAVLASLPPSWSSARAQATPAAPSSPKITPRLPLEFTHGPLFSDKGKYWIAGSFLPGIGYSKLDLNLVLSGVYRNPEWDFGSGGRVSVALLSFFEGAVQVRGAIQGEYLWRAHNARTAVGILPDLSSILRLGFWFGRDWDLQRSFVGFSVSTDPWTYGDPVGALLRAGPMEDFGHGPR